jgi:thiosulfate dehydrogenase (quinone) large subunit
MRPDPSRTLTNFQQGALFALRTLIGWHFLYEGIYKLSLPGWAPDGKPLPAWSALGFLKAATGPLGDLARWCADHGMLTVIDKLVMFGIAAVGLSLILGLFTRAGCIGGLVLLSMFYFLAIPLSGMPQPQAEGSYLIVNKTLIEGIAVLVLLSFDTGRIAGLDRLWRNRRQYPLAVPAADQGAFEQGSGS